MLNHLLNKEVTIHFLDGSCVRGGILEAIEENFINYADEYQSLYIPVTSIRSISIDTKERQRPRVGFAQ
ncbi:hypothetical protein [Paenibacillus tuaregi]|uniref:hypothetical protein n=1 Tax=Paenibacillus tuaregi TaxID=1816681 RepID=UPI00083974AE|nr:hypothetical protein [Paenibacillus tuaregi]